jgi:Uncharacterized protein conserved in bacteria
MTQYEPAVLCSDRGDRRRICVAVIALVARRGPSGDVEAQLVNRLEVIDRGLRDEFSRNREEAGAAAKNQREELGKSLENVRGIVDLRLQELQKDNAQQIERMRATVDEKLHGTLEKRLGESFKLVSERLEQVHQGLGAMRQLATGCRRVTARPDKRKDARRLERMAARRPAGRNADTRSVRKKHEDA